MDSTRLLVSRTLGVFALAAFLVLPVAAARAQDPDADNPVVARANGIDIRANDLA
jgi:hypothetical protein